MDSLLQDLRFAFRLLAKSPGFAAVAISMLAVGIGATSSVFSVADALLLRPLPYPEPERLVTVFERDAAGQPGNTSEPNFLDLHAATHSFEALAATDRYSMTLTGAGEAERVQAAGGSADLFRVLGVAPDLGRGFAAGEDAPGYGQIAVVSHAFWRDRLGADPAAVGRAITLNRVDFTVIGVMPEGFRAPLDLDAELWTNLQVDPKESRTGHHLRAVGRLARGVTKEQARAEMRPIAEEMVRRFPRQLAGTSFDVADMHEAIFGDTRRPLTILLGAAAAVLLVACANLSNLLLARGVGRARELAIRTALGAGRARAVRQMLTESLLLAGIGGAAGLLVAVWATDLLVAAGPATLRLTHVALDGRVVAFAAGLSLLSGLVFGLAPALSGVRADLQAVLKATAPAAGGARGLRAALIALQIGLALTLLTGAGLLLKSFSHLLAVDTGFDPRQVLTSSLSLPYQGYTKDEQRIDFYDRLLARLEALPGVVGVGIVTPLPLSPGYDQVGFEVEGRSYASEAEEPTADRYIVTPGYFGAMRIALSRGRLLGAEDRPGAVATVVVDEVLARQLWPGEEPLGKRLLLPSGNDETKPALVVGVVAHVKQYGLDVAGIGQLYLPLAQLPARNVSLVVRSTGDLRALAAQVRGEVRAIDPDQPVFNVEPMAELVTGSAATRRFLTLLVSLFAATGVALAAVGLYAVIAHAAAARTREVGIRMALGARRRDVLRLVGAQALGLVAGGLALGAAGAAALSHLLASELFEVTPGDPAVLAGVALLLAGVALAATYLPARRASLVDPSIALRAE